MSTLTMGKKLHTKDKALSRRYRTVFYQSRGRSCLLFVECMYCSLPKTLNLSKMGTGTPNLTYAGLTTALLTKLIVITVKLI